MRLRWMGVFAGALLVACGGSGAGSNRDGSSSGDDDGGTGDAVGNAAQACADYITAATDCYAQAGVSAPVDSAVCDEYEGLTGLANTESAELFRCYADVLDSGDCSDQGAASATLASISDCIE